MANTKKPVLKTLVVNIFGGPGAGKSTLAFDICARLKRAGIITEFTGEAAKELVWEHPDLKSLPYQLHLFAEQQKRIDRLLGKVEVIVTDSPAPNFLMFDTTGNEHYPKLVMAEFNKTRNINFLVERAFDYEKEGRTQTEEEAVKAGRDLEEIMFNNGIPYYKAESLEGSAAYPTGIIIDELDK